MKAWVDESVRETGVPTPMYLLGASLTQDTAQQEVSEALLRLAPRGRKLHWRDLGDRGRNTMLEFLPSLRIEHVVVIAAPLRSGIKQERARGQCFQQLLWELQQRNVDHVTFEARTPAQDKADKRRVDGLRSRHLIPRSLRADWVPGANQPLLWTPDLVLGAVGQARAYNLPLSPALSALVTEVRIEL